MPIAQESSVYIKIEKAIEVEEGEGEEKEVENGVEHLLFII